MSEKDKILYQIKALEKVLAKNPPKPWAIMNKIKTLKKQASLINDEWDKFLAQ